MESRWHGVDQLAARFLTPAEYQAHLDNIACGEPGNMLFKCPHCRSIARVRTSRELSELMREAYFQCSNIVCGHVFKTYVEVVETVSPSSQPDPEMARQIASAKPVCFERPPTAIERQRMARLENSAKADQARKLLREPEPA